MNYKSPVGNRYGTMEMNAIFSDENRHTLWRMIWASIAQAQQTVGLNITDEQIDEMRMNVGNIDYNRITQLEYITHHDVMAHIQEFSERCPKSAPIIHLGATSSDIVDNADIILIAFAIEETKGMLIDITNRLINIAKTYNSVPMVGYTHLQKAQLTTVGKRICLWLQDIIMDIDAIDNLKWNIRLRGLGGATGTQASFKELVGSDDMVLDMETYFIELLNEKLNLDLDIYPIVSQTYPRKVDMMVLGALSNISQSASKFANDIRLLQHTGEICEGFSNGQVGSSAMPYKRNPLNCEKICSLSRIVQSNYIVMSQNASNQWLERTLDDSANRRIVIPESFILISEILQTYYNVIDNIVINIDNIMEHVQEHKTTIILENIMMEAVRNGGNRQRVHEIINEYSGKYTGQELINRVTKHDDVMVDDKFIQDLSEDILIGRARQQVEDYIQWIEYRMGDNIVKHEKEK